MRRCLVAAVGLALLGACAGNELNVVSPDPAALAAQQQELAGATTTSSVLVPLVTTTTTSTTTPPTTQATTTTTAPTTTAPTTTTTEAAPPPTLEELSLAFVNERRAGEDRGPLTLDPDLTAAAEGWAAELVASQELGHNPNLSEVVPDRFRTWGENVAYSSTASNIDQMWWESDGHRANILNPDFTAIGIAFVDDASGITWAVQVFGG